ncbi:MAG TPA: hypothetical protein VGN16_14740 [Acidobacteriaceae bacterium]|jgi:hypothetical protein
MKSLLVIAISVSLAGSSALAQSTQAPTSATAQSRMVRRVMSPPKELQPKPSVRPSTAGSGLIHRDKEPLKVMPNFSGVGLDNQPHDSASLQHTGHWLLVYRTERCVPCDRLMNALAASESKDLRGGEPYTVIVGSTSPTALDTVRAGYSTLSSANWVADRDHKIFTALQLRGEPTVFAMDGSRVIWHVAGSLGDPQKVLHMADAWIAGSAAAADAAKAAQSVKTSPPVATGSTKPPVSSH